MDYVTAVRAYAPHLPPDQVAEVATEAERSCVWHAVAQWHRHHFVPLACGICGGDLPPKVKGQHELCQARRRLGLSTPRLDFRIECPCAKCVARIEG